MYCLKCGKDTKGDHVFCQSCIEIMDKYPVKADAHVQLPNRSATSAQRRSGKKRHLVTPDEQIATLQKRVRRLALLALVLILLLSASVVVIARLSKENENLQPTAQYSVSDVL